MHFLKNTEALTQNMLMCFTGNEEYTKQTLKTVSSILSDSPRRKNIVHDDVAHVLGDVKKRDKRLAEGGLKGPQEDTRQHFDDLALKNSHDFRDEGASHLHPAEMPNENVNKIQDTDVIAEDGSMADNKENVPMILPDEHHLFKQPEISSVEGNEGTGVARESNDELEIDNSEQGITQQSLAAHTVPEENSLSSSIKASMLKDVIALNRTDDATSFDDVSLQDDNDQGFESLPCDQTLDPEDLNEEQHVKDELDNAEKLLPAGDDDNIGADKLTALLDELAEHEKATPVSLQYDTGVQTTPTDVTDQNNEPVFEPKLRSLASNDDSDKEGSAQKCAHGIRSDENVHPAPSMSSDNEEQIVLSVQITGSKSGESGSAVPDEHKVTEIAGHKRDCEGISDAGIEKNTSKISEYYIDLHSVDTSGWPKSLQEKEEEKASEQIVKSDKYENEHSANQATGVNNKIGIENAQTSEKESVDIAVATEASVRDERDEEFAMEKPVNKSSKDNEIAEVKTENLMGESSETAAHNEASVQCETSEGFPSNESVKKSTNDNELVKLELESSETKLRKIEVRDEESMQNEFAMEKPVNKSSTDNEIPEVKTENLMGESSETAAHNEASVQCETSEGFPSNESVKESTNDNELVKMESEPSETKLRKIEVRDEESMQNETSEEVACGPTAHPSSSDIGVPKLERESFIGEISELASTEASVPNETSEESESEAPINRSTNDEVTVVKAETPVSEISETATSNEAGVQNETFEDFASEEPVSQSTGKIREETSTEQLAFTEARAQSNKYDQFANQRYPSHITDDKHDNNVNADASLSEFPQIAVIDELNVQSKTSDVLGSEESVNQSNANIEVIKVKAEASINELPKVVIPNEVSAQNTPEEFASGETACPTTSDSDVPKVKAEVSNSEDPKNVVSTEESERIETMEESASEVSVNENMNKMITRVEPDAPVSEFPETSLSSELSAERKTSDEFTSEEPVNLGTNNNEVTKVNAQASVSEMTEILVSNEERVYSTSEEFASEGTAHPNTSDIAITKVKAGTSFGEVPEIVVYDEASVRNEASEEPASEAPMNLSTNEETRVESDASVSDMPEIAVFNENSAENKTSGQLACEEYGKQNDNDDENTKVKIVTSVSELHEIIASNETTDQSKKSGEFASGEAARHSASDVANTEAKEGASTSEVSQTTIADEASMQSERSTKFGNEAHVSETTNENIAEAKADTSTELPKIILSNEASVRNKPTEGFISEEPVNQGSNNEEIAKADEEEVGSESTETIVPNEASVQVVGVETEFQIISDYEATKGPAETSTSVVPENIVSGEASLLSQTPEKFENEALGNDSPRDNAIPEVKSEASASELPFNEASVQSIASEEFANGESTQETNGVVEVATLKADVPISEVPEIAVSNEVILPKKSHEELKNNATVNESTNDNEVTEVMAGASVIELPEETVPNEASIGNEISDELTSNENVHQSNSDKGNGELRPDTAK
ncbi:uncharacterized protein LOC119445921 [Dermacentor silvarum]|uniref:uncharacterized protein LOC119445921 n=1 Tax=Dermacentor silvarum TaxID=543639 RepID=UPI00189B6120|nr:uncharacterized protein LOC119445921 [Dermacentor silvarum]